MVFCPASILLLDAISDYISPEPVCIYDYQCWLPYPSNKVPPSRDGLANRPVDNAVDCVYSFGRIALIQQDV